MSEKKKEKRNILLCVAGMTPQIITETLYALHKRGERVDEVRVITTLEGRNKVLRSLLDEKAGKFYEFCRDYKIDAAGIKFDETTIALLDKPDGTILSDIRTEADNETAGDKICKIVAELCKDAGARIHASAAGGRKTMSIYLTAAMQLFGRADDRLSHVLVSEDFENHPEFFYKPPQPKLLAIRDRETKKVLREISTADAEIYLAPIPFVRLRGMPGAPSLSEGQSYCELVGQAQKFLDTEEKDFPLRIDLRKSEIAVGKLRVEISGYQLLLFALFAAKKHEAAGENSDGFVYLKDLRRSDFEAAFRKIIFAKQGEECPLTKERLENSEWKFLLELVAQCESRNVKDYEDFMNSIIRAVGRANKALRRANFPPRYEITSKGNARPKKYGLGMAKDKIEWLGDLTQDVCEKD